MKITKRQLRRIIKEEKAKLVNEIQADPDVRQLVLNQDEVDQVLAMSDAVAPLLSVFQKLRSVPQSYFKDGTYDKIEQILFDLPEDLRSLANDMKKGGI